MSWCVKLCIIVSLVCFLSTPGDSQFIRRTTRRSSSSSLTVILSSISASLFAVSICISLCVLCYRLSKRGALGTSSSRYRARRVYNSSQQERQQHQQLNYVIQEQQGGWQPAVGQVDSHGDQQNVRYAMAFITKCILQ